MRRQPSSPATARRWCPAAAAASCCSRPAAAGLLLDSGDGRHRGCWASCSRRRSRGDPRRPSARSPSGDERRAAFDVVDLIRAKRDGGRLDRRRHRLADRRLRPRTGRRRADVRAADGDLLPGPGRRASCGRGPRAMIASGERLDLSGARQADRRQALDRRGRRQGLADPRAAGRDAAAPPCRSCPGRGLGHTGGTLDKLESIPGWRAELTTDEIASPCSSQVGCVICAAGARAGPGGPQALRAARRHRRRSSPSR